MHNTATLHIINAGGGSMNIHDCTFNNNRSGIVHSTGCVYQANTCATTFSNNIVHDNECADGTISSIYTYENEVLISGNKIYNNKNWGNAAINIFGGKTIIENNYVCNNTDDSATCGILAGGGGIHVGGEYASITSTDTITKIVRNNIIANNQSSSRGSAIYVYQCNAAIVNNDIINNNNSANDGAISAYYGTNVNRLTVRNNIIFGNVNGALGVVSDIYLLNNNRMYLQYDHNWTQRDFAANVYSPSVADSMIQESSVTNNVISSSPGMASPTSTSSVAESALRANFSLTSGSVCIDSGMSCSYSGFYDYIYNYRIAGGNIDIGAYEYGSHSFPVGTAEVVSKNNTAMVVYPNPASGIINIATPSASGEILLMDLSGRLFSKTAVSDLTTTIDIHNLSAGMYFISWAYGTTRYTQKVIVQ